ncbi:MAG: N-acetylglucosamine-6-phosphate deacetylase [Cellulomonadaceae bacterium]
MAEITAGQRLLRGRVVLPEEVLEDGVILVADGRIELVGLAQGAAADGFGELLDEVPPPGPDVVLIPGLVDVHCHGGGGASFPDAEDAATAMTAVLEHRRHGTTSLVASLVTAAPETLRARTDVLRALADAGEIAGIHLEGPFVSARRCGAQDPALIQDPDPALVRELADRAGGHLMTMTLAPERPGNLGPGGVSAALVAAGALPSFGHTDAESGEMRAGLEEAYRLLGAAEAAARSRRPTVTHLFNGMRPLHHREDGPVPDALAAAGQGRAVLELVGDGTHLHPALVRDVFDLVGAQSIALVTDAMAAAGMPDGAYRLGSAAVVVRGGVARLAEGDAIAGGTAHLIDVVRVAVDAGVPLAAAVRAASLTPATVLGRTDVGAIEEGRRADLVVLDAALRVREVLRAGQPV